jgi:cytochrome c5
MYRRSLFFLVAASCWLAASGSAGLPASSAQTRPAGAASAPTGPEFRAFLNQYCTTCHNEQAKTAGLMLDKLDVTNVGPNAEAWEKVIVKLRAGMMPPSGSRRPDQAAYDRSVAWLESALDAENLAHPNPGTTGLHRLNRTEYANAIRDLLTLDIDVAPLLPPDDPLYGFDNIAEALGVTPILMERYLAAADKVSALAVGGRLRDHILVLPRPAGSIAGPARRGPAFGNRRRHCDSRHAAS